MALAHLPADGADAARTQRIGGQAADLHVHRHACGPGGMQGGRTLGLQCHHMGSAVHPGGHAADEAAAAHADEQAVGQPAALLLDLQGQRAGAGHHLGLVIGMGLQRARGLLAGHAGLKGLGIRGAGHHHLGPQGAQPGALGLGRDLGHEHLAAHAQGLGGGRHGNAGVAARGDDDAAVGHGIGQQAIEHAARLEAATHLQLLQLEPDLVAIHPQRAARQAQQRRGTQKARLAGQLAAGSGDGGAMDHAGTWRKKGAV